MTLPTSLIEWCWFTLKVLLAVTPPSLIAWLWKEITAHSLYVYAQRTSPPHSDHSTYRFAVQNNEDEALIKPTLEIRILDQDGRFFEPPLVYAGCSTFKAELDPEAKACRLTFSSLPAYDTWSIDCKMTSFARNVRLEVEEKDTRLTGNTLTIRADQLSRLTGRRGSTEWWWTGLATLLAAGSYASLVVLGAGRLDGQDWPFILSILSFGVLLRVLNRMSSPRIAFPITQGYWEPVRATLLGPSESRDPSQPDSRNEFVA